jgi:transcriptional regulator
VLIHPWDAALDEAEWRTWLADGHDFGQLVVNGLPGQPPSVVPTHFVVDETPDGTDVLVHLARPNPVWAALEADPHVVLSVVDDYAYIPTAWRAKAGGPDEDGVPTSYYAAVQLRCRAEIVDDPGAKADLLTRQLAHFQPAGDHADVAVAAPPYGRMLPGIRGLRLHVTGVAAKFKYDDANPEEHRTRVATHLDARATGRDPGAADQQRRRLARIGTWRPR